MSFQVTKSVLNCKNLKYAESAESESALEVWGVKKKGLLPARTTSH